LPLLVLHSSTQGNTDSPKQFHLSWGRFASLVLQKRPHPALPICGSENFHTDKYSLLLDDLPACLSTYLALACSLHNDVDKVLYSSLRQPHLAPRPLNVKPIEIPA
jgi:hypothetical protein